MSHLRDAYGRNSSNSARSMSNMLGVWIQISGFCRGITTNNNTKNPLSPERQNSPQFGVRLPAKPRNAGSIAFFQIAGVFFIKGGIFSRAGCFFSGGVSRAMRLRYPLRDGRVFFFRVAAASVFRAARGGRASVRGAGVYFFEETHIPQLFPHGRTRLLQKKFRASERIGYQGTAIFAQPPAPCRTSARGGRTRPQTRHPQPKRPYPPSPSESPDRPHACRPSCPHVACPLPTRPPTPHTPYPSDHRLFARPSTRRTAPVCPSRRARTLAQQAPTYRARLSVRSVRALARRTAYARPSEPAICQIRKCFRHTTC